MPFPSANDLLSQQTNNQNIANVILATRPYGATPLAGMLKDAEYYLWNDPTGPEKSDSLVHCGMRPQYIIILTDGAPNWDMRNSDPASPQNDCTKTSSGIAGVTPSAGSCPFDLPENITGDLFKGSAGAHSVTTFVLGFAVSSVVDGAATIQCSSLVNNGLLSSTCSDPTKQSI